MSGDGRMPLQVVEQVVEPGGAPGAAARAALLVVGPAAVAPGAGWVSVGSVPDQEVGWHRPACVCGACGGRSPLATALGVLFLQRARGEIADFDRVVVVVPPGRGAAIAGALRADLLVGGRFLVR